MLRDNPRVVQKQQLRTFLELLSYQVVQFTVLPEVAILFFVVSSSCLPSSLVAPFPGRSRVGKLLRIRERPRI